MPPLPTLPPVERLLHVCKAIAMLDAVLSPEWEYRYYSFNSKWGPGEQMASMRNGSGDSYFVLFNEHGAILKGYDHESPAARHVIEHGDPLPGMFDGVPEDFAEFLREPAFSIEDTTFCCWRRHSDPQWSVGGPQYPPSPDPSGALWLLAILQGDPDAYVEFARDYYEVPIGPEAVRRIYGHEPMTLELAHALNPNVTLQDLQGDIEEIGHPRAGPI